MNLPVLSLEAAEEVSELQKESICDDLKTVLVALIKNLRYSRPITDKVEREKSLDSCIIINLPLVDVRSVDNKSKLHLLHHWQLKVRDAVNKLANECDLHDYILVVSPTQVYSEILKFSSHLKDKVKGIKALETKSSIQWETDGPQYYTFKEGKASDVAEIIVDQDGVAQPFAVIHGVNYARATRGRRIIEFIENKYFAMIHPHPDTSKFDVPRIIPFPDLNDDEIEDMDEIDEMMRQGEPQKQEPSQSQGSERKDDIRTKTEIKDLYSKIENQKKDNKEATDDLNKRILNQDTQIAGNNSKLCRIENRVDDTQNNIKTLREKVEAADMLAAGKTAEGILKDVARLGETVDVVLKSIARHDKDLKDLKAMYEKNLQQGEKRTYPQDEQQENKDMPEVIDVNDESGNRAQRKKR